MAALALAITGLDLARGHGPAARTGPRGRGVPDQHLHQWFPAVAGAGGARGRVRVGDEEWEIDGHGLRDHSWGPRFWQAPWWYRWLTGNCGEDFGFMLSIIAGRSGKRSRGGIIFEDGQYKPVRHCTIETGWRGEDVYHQTIAAVASTDERSYQIRGAIVIPICAHKV